MGRIVGRLAVGRGFNGGLVLRDRGGGDNLQNRASLSLVSLALLLLFTFENSIVIIRLQSHTVLAIHLERRFIVFYAG